MREIEQYRICCFGQSPQNPETYINNLLHILQVCNLHLTNH